MKTELEKMDEVLAKKEALSNKIFDLIQEFEVESDKVQPHGFIDDIMLSMTDEFNDKFEKYEEEV